MVIVNGYPDYVIDENGNVYDQDGVQRKPIVAWKNYLYVNLYSRTLEKWVLLPVHKLVCQHFNGPAPEDRPWVLHYSDDRHDNNHCNLYWGTRQDNADDSKRNGKQVSGDTVWRAMEKAGWTKEKWSKHIKEAKAKLDTESRGSAHSRAIKEGMKRSGYNQIGSNNHLAKIDESVAAEIKRRLLVGQSRTQIMIDLGVSEGVLNGIMYRGTWSYVLPAAEPS